MKKLKIGLLAYLLSAGMYAQSPQSIKYQGVARNATGNILANQGLNVRLTIKNGSATGPAVYIETHSVTTNPFGLYNINLGLGTVVSGTFSAIAWGSGSKFIEQEVDFGSGFQSMGVSQFI